MAGPNQILTTFTLLSHVQRRPKLLYWPGWWAGRSGTTQQDSRSGRLYVRTIKRLCQITLITSCLPRQSRPHQIRMDLMLRRLMTLPWEQKTEKIQLCLSLLTGRALEGPSICFLYTHFLLCLLSELLPSSNSCQCKQHLGEGAKKHVSFFRECMFFSTI